MADLSESLSRILDSEVAVDFRAAADSLLNGDETVAPNDKLRFIYALARVDLEASLPDMRENGHTRPEILRKLEEILEQDDHAMLLQLAVGSMASAGVRLVPFGEGQIIDDYLAELIMGIPHEGAEKVLKAHSQVYTVKRLMTPRHPSAFSRGVQNPDGSYASELTEIGKAIAHFLETHSGISLDATAKNMKDAKLRYLAPKLTALHS